MRGLVGRLAGVLVFVGSLMLLAPVVSVVKGQYTTSGGSSYSNLFSTDSNTLAVRNGTTGQRLDIFNTYTSATIYERGSAYWSSNNFYVGTSAAGGGTARRLILTSAASDMAFATGGTSIQWWIAGNAFYNQSTDTGQVGSASYQLLGISASRFIQGSKSKALTEGAATNFVTVAVPQTAGANYAGGEVRYSVYATDGTESQVLNGSAFFSAVNKAGTETCTLTDDQIGTEAASSGTLACTPTCVVGLTDVVAMAMDCTSSLTQTALNVEYRLDMPKPNTVTPQ